MSTLRSCVAGGSKQSPEPKSSQWPEFLCFQSDASSGLVHYVMKELRDGGHLQLETVQKASLIGMEGAKGKHSFGRNSSTALLAFSRTATHVLRMVMLEACGVEPEHWPSGGESSYKNEKKLTYEQIYGSKLVLASSYEEAREYWSEFDKMYPHYLLEKFLEERTGSLNNIMFIFRNYMQEVVEVSMDVCAVHTGGKNISCCASCMVVRRKIDLTGASGKWLDTFEMVVRGTRAPLTRHFNMLLDLDPTHLSLEELESTLSVLYDSLPTKKNEIDDSQNYVKPPPYKEPYPTEQNYKLKYRTEEDNNGNRVIEKTVCTEKTTTTTWKELKNPAKGKTAAQLAKDLNVKVEPEDNTEGNAVETRAPEVQSAKQDDSTERDSVLLEA